MFPEPIGQQAVAEVVGVARTAGASVNMIDATGELALGVGGQRC